jgi:exopolyphosphatase/guanosine-5'-triphosphate,3'-diphosphate pyrophosphatase
MVRRLAGILRIADNLDRGHRHLVKQVKLEILPNIIWMRVKAADKIDIEIRAVQENKELFEQVFEKQLEIEQV